MVYIVVIAKAHLVKVVKNYGAFMRQNKKKRSAPLPESKNAKYWLKFGGFLKSKRLESGLSIEVVTGYIGASEDLLIAYESGERPVPLNKIYALSNCLSISPDEITDLVAAYPDFPVKKNNN